MITRLIFFALMTFSNKSIATNLINDCIYNNKHDKSVLKIKENFFEISFIENSPKTCINPNFPSIHISTSFSHNAWMQVIFTDSNELELKHIIDSDTSSDLFPLYTTEENFFDAPKWSYTILHKPIKTWIANCYALNIDNVKKLITIHGPIEWGFYFKYPFSTKPQMIHPNLNPIYKKESELLIKKSILNKYPDYKIIF